jgi:hypothetical protein
MKTYISKQERRFLYISLLKKGYSSSQATEEINMLIASQLDLSKKKTKEKREKNRDKNKLFKDSFKKLTEEENAKRTNTRRYSKVN